MRPSTLYNMGSSRYITRYRLSRESCVVVWRRWNERKPRYKGTLSTCAGFESRYVCFQVRSWPFNCVRLFLSRDATFFSSLLASGGSSNSLDDIYACKMTRARRSDLTRSLINRCLETDIDVGFNVCARLIKWLYSYSPVNPPRGHRGQSRVTQYFPFVILRATSIVVSPDALFRHEREILSRENGVL